MTPYDQMSNELRRLAGHTGPTSVIARAIAADGTTIEAEMVAVDAHGCLVRAVQATSPRLTGGGVTLLQEWGEALSRRISYLLETLGLLEIDQEQGQVLIRSNPPDRQGNTTSYYEVLLSEEGPGRFVLRRYETQKGTGGRAATDMQLTHQMLARLARDLVETTPPRP